MNVLIPNVGRRGYMVNYIRNICGFDGKIFVSDCDKSASGLYSNNDGHFILSKPVNDEEKYINSLLALCEEKQISVIVPVIDPEIFILSKYLDLFTKKKILLPVSSKEVINICYNKLLMNKFLKTNGFSVPKTYKVLKNFFEDYNSGNINFPVIIKPIYGSGSESTYRVSSKEEVKVLFHEGMIIQDYIDGQELGADVFNDMNKKPVRCVIKKKISMRSGETDKAISIKNTYLQNTLIHLAKCLGHIGNLDVDIIVSDTATYIIDLNPRFGGGYPITHEVGVNLLELIIKMSKGEKILPEFNNYEEDIMVMKTIGVVKVKINNE